MKIHPKFSKTLAHANLSENPVASPHQATFHNAKNTRHKIQILPLASQAFLCIVVDYGYADTVNLGSSTADTPQPRVYFESRTWRRHLIFRTISQLALSSGNNLVESSRVLPESHSRYRCLVPSIWSDPVEFS
jgi:hypothetical protein